MPPLNSFNRTCLALAIGQIVSGPAHAATILVNSALDNGDGANCTLREAITSINNASLETGCDNTGEGFGNDTINFSNAALPNPTTITLSGTQLSFNSATNVSIDGLGQARLTVSANNLSRVFYSDGAIVNISNLTITQGSASVGGGVYANNSSSITFTNSTVSGNTSSGYGGGGISAKYSSSITLTNSTVSGNSSSRYGGGISARYSSSITLTNSSVSGNSANNGGGLHASSSSSINLINSTVSGNSAENDGGGVYAVRSSITLTNSTVSGNSAADEGGGIRASRQIITLSNSTVSANSAGYGGGIHANNSSSIALTNSTVSGNSADEGGGIGAVSSNVSLINNIVSGNTATSIGDDILSSASTFTADNNNLFGDSDSSKDNTSAFAGFTPGGDDITATSDGTQPTALSSILDPLANNGGPTQTHALVTGSPAIDEGDDAVCAAEPVYNLDQRGRTRPIGPQCDIGAFESGNSSLFVIPLPNGKVAVIPL